MKQFSFEAFGSTNQGPVRKNNEDVYALVEKHKFFVLADGMGGHNAGEVAAKEATDFVCQRAQEKLFNQILSSKKIFTQFKENFQKTNEHVFTLSQNHPSLKGMGTTLCCLYFYKNRAHFGHVGDSRIYRLRKKRLKLLTEDHAVVNYFFKNNLSLNLFPMKRAITRAIGIHQKVEPDIASVNLQMDDLFLMCSDGLSDYVPIDQIKKILISNSSNNIITQNLIEQAIKNGSSDNITVLLIRVKKIK